MLCNVCKQNEATVHITEIVDDQIKKVDLCEACKKEKGVSDPVSYALADMLLGLGGAQSAEPAAETKRKCPTCGYTQAEFKKAGRFGCADCYVTFADGLDGLLKNMHKGTRHVGKVPAALQRSRDYTETLKSMQKKLEKAVSDENFEQAARLRDEIKVLKEKAAPSAVL
jgi:protein arginine kinase activator